MTDDKNQPNDQIEYEGVRDDRHPTGITSLDEETLRGIPEGSTVAVLGNPDSATELLLHSLAATGRKTQYITTLRSENSVRKDILRLARERGIEESVNQNLTLRDVYTQSNEYSDSIRRALGTIGDGNLIVDTYSTFHDKNDQAEVARGIQSDTENNGGVTYLYFTVEDTDKLSRDEKEILQICDAVFNVKTEVVSDNVQNRLFINKLRGMDYPDSSQQLVYGIDIDIDTTRGIG